MSKISLVVPYMESDPEKRAILRRMIDSVVGYDELIISSNWKEGYAKPINRGFSLAKGDFLVMATDDIIFQEGKNDLRDLIDEKAVTSPIVNGKLQDFWGMCFCLPRWVYEKVGGLWEGYRISYWDDEDYIGKLKRNNIPMHGVEKVVVDHPEGGRTLHTFPEWQSFFEENKRIYEWRKSTNFED